MKTTAPWFRPARAALISLLLAPFVSSANVLDYLFARNDLETITVTDVTPAGNGLRQPTSDQPVYYAAVSAGYHDLGAIKAGEKPIPRRVVDQTMLKILAKQGYLPAAPGHQPDVILVWSWGTLNVEVFHGMNGVTYRTVNEGQMLRFLGGTKLGLTAARGDPFPELTLQTGLIPLSGDANALLETAKDDLYVATIAAYAVNLQGSLDASHATLLWNTRISAPARGFWMPEALPAMLAVASPYVGRETAKPVWIRATDKFKPEVHLGDLKVVEYLEKTPVTVVAVGPSS